MTDFLTDWTVYTWDMIYESGFLLLIGFILAGVIRALLTPTALTSFFGKGRFTQIFTASIIGVPLPLCSCSVLPVAAQLRRSGLSREGTVSFLISTPETGADSIALSVKLLGPIFAVVRPIAALFTALVSGLVTLFLVKKNDTQINLPVIEPASQKKPGLISRLWEGQVYVVTDMIPELAYYLFWGYVLAGAAAALIPTDLLQSGLAPWLQYAGVIAVSLPVYVCATSSTPLAAVLMSLGILPGAVLTFLLVGPATNLTSLVVQKRILGLKVTVMMTASIIICAVICGVVMDRVWGGAISGFSLGEDQGEGTPVWYDLAGAILLTFAMVFFTAKHYYKMVKKVIEGKK
jgi:uncharacterized membrane protein YraQ (UPF0718 family)